MLENCRYNGRANFLQRFYTNSMSLRIKALRKSRGLTQDQLASRANMSRSQLAEIENETRPANTLRLNAIAAALSVPVDELFDDGDATKPIMDIFRQLSEEDRSSILRMAEALVAKESKLQ